MQSCKLARISAPKLFDRRTPAAKRSTWKDSGPLDKKFKNKKKKKKKN